LLSDKQKKLAKAIRDSTEWERPQSVSKRGIVHRLASLCACANPNFSEEDLAEFLAYAEWDNTNPALVRGGSPPITFSNVLELRGRF
jgi:hypothetical protein